VKMTDDDRPSLGEKEVPEIQVSSCAALPPQEVKQRRAVNSPTLKGSVKPCQQFGRAGRGRKTSASVVPKSPTIPEVTEDSSTPPPTAPKSKFAGHPSIIKGKDCGTPPSHRRREGSTEYTSLMPSRNKKRYGTSNYNVLTDSSGEDENDTGDYSASDEVSSNSSITSKMNTRQYLIFSMIMLSSLSSSFTVCLFPPFFPMIAEMKGATATGYGLIIGTNCLVAFLVTPSIGNHLSTIGVKFAFCAGLLGGGVCCALSGFLEFFEPGIEFFVMAVLIRAIHAISNALVITSTFTYTACEFPTSIAKIFSMTRCVMNVAQLGGPALGGLMYEAGGFFCPFVIMGSIQVLIAGISTIIMPMPEQEEEGEDDCQHDHRKKKNKVSVLKMLCIPTIWFSFAAFIVATMCNGFLSLNLEPQVLRGFSFSPFYVGLLFGLKDGANSLASPFWGWICDRNKKSVKPYLIISSVLVAGSFFLMGASSVVGLNFQLTIPLLIFALCLNGAGIGGQQVAGVVDALHEASAAGYPDSPATQGLVAGLWSSLSGAGRFISRAGSGFLVDQFGFQAVSSIACGLQCLVGITTFLFLVMCECSLQSRNQRLRWEEVTIVEQGKRRDERVVFTTNSSPSESLMPHSVYMGIPNTCSGQRMATRIANSMPPKKWNNYYETSTNHSRSVR